MALSARQFLRPTVTLILISLTAAGLRNTFADNSLEKDKAEIAACGSAGCSIKLLSEARSALGQSFSFQTKDGAQGGGVVKVECKRELIFLGDYQCVQAP